VAHENTHARKAPLSFENYLHDLVRKAVTEGISDAQALASQSLSAREFLTLSEAAERAAVSKGTIRNWVKSGKLRTCGTGRVLRIKVRELDALLTRGAAGDERGTEREQADMIMARLARNTGQRSGG
jgi:excisionase family DNA binding protein